MKIHLANRTAAYIACCVLLVSAAIAGTGCSSSVPLTTDHPIGEADGPFRYALLPVPNSSTIQLIVQKPAGKNVWITFKGPDGQDIEKLCTPQKGEGVFRHYNFTEAIEGTYSLEITDGKETVTKLLTLGVTVPHTIRSMTIK